MFACSSSCLWFSRLYNKTQETYMYNLTKRWLAMVYDRAKWRRLIMPHYHFLDGKDRKKKKKK